MPIQGRYIGRTERGYQGMNIIHNRIYPIEICPNEYGYNYVVKIYYSNPLEKIVNNKQVNMETSHFPSPGRRCLGRWTGGTDYVKTTIIINKYLYQ